MKKLQMLALAGPLVCLVPTPGFAQVAVLTDPEYLAGAPTPITAHETVWMQEMTWPEIRDAIQLYGKTTAIVATGGVEQNGPFSVTGKHNFLVEKDAQAIAERLGNALVAPVIPFSPEDYSVGRPGDHLLYPGTFHMPSELFKAVLREYCINLKRSGFTDIMIIAENLPSNELQEEVAATLNAEWAGEETRVYHLQEYYDQHRVMDEDLRDRGIVQESQGIHDSFRVTATLMAVDPTLVRLQQRIAAGPHTASINGISILPAITTIEHGRRMSEAKVVAAVEAIRRYVAEHRRGM